MKTLEYWNHNTAYYNWIKQNVSNCNYILDVGCGNGSLIKFLDDGKKQFVGIDSSELCINKAQNENSSSLSQFVLCNFENFNSSKPFDAIIFVASIHHMDMLSTINKAKSMLSENGILLIVGLAKPSTLLDYIIEGFRVLPCLIISKCKHIHSSEDENIPVSYKLPFLNEIRDIMSKELPLCTFKQGLYYRYLISWKKH